MYVGGTTQESPRGVACPLQQPAALWSAPRKEDTAADVTRNRSCGVWAGMWLNGLSGLV